MTRRALFLALLYVVGCCAQLSLDSHFAGAAGDALIHGSARHLLSSSGVAARQLSSSPVTEAVSAALQAGGVSPGSRLHAVVATKDDNLLLRNWARYVRLGRIPHAALLALDADTVAAGARLKLLTLDVSALPAMQYLVGRAAIVPVIRAALEYGVDVLLSEPDVVWLRNPDMYLAVYDMLAADVLVASQCRYHFVARPNVDSRTGALREPVDSQMSLSVLLVKPSAGGIALVDAWIQALANRSSAELAALAALGEGDQMQVMLDTFSDTLLHSGIHAPQKVAWLSDVPGGSWDVAAREDLFPRYPPRVNDGTQVMPYKTMLANNVTIGVGILPTGLFANPHTWFAANLPTQYRLRPYALHAGKTHTDGSHHGAALRLREAGLWLGDDGSAQTPKRALRVLLQVPKNLTAAVQVAAGNRSSRWDPEALWVAHVELVAWQVHRVREAAVLAAATGRSLQLPPLLCGCDEHDTAAPESPLPGLGQPGRCGPGETPSPPFPCSLSAGFNPSELEARLMQPGSASRDAAFSVHIAPTTQKSQSDKQQPAPVLLRLCAKAPCDTLSMIMAAMKPRTGDDDFDAAAGLATQRASPSAAVVDLTFRSPMASTLVALSPHEEVPVVEVTLSDAEQLFAPGSVQDTTATAVRDTMSTLARVSIST